jgi:alpha-1,6-mannosyltransferase
LLPGGVALDDDVYRYLWDGGVAAHGFDPYRQSPAEVVAAPRDARLGQLAGDAAGVLQRINHADLTTIYPPVATAAFAIGHVLAPWSVTGWRCVVLLLELATCAGVLALLRECRRSPLWVALYWWHPLALKELAHAGHMEAVLLPLLVWAIVSAARGRLALSMMLLGCATATKFWPALLLPLLLRPQLSRPVMAAALAALYATVSLILLAPMAWNGLGADSGLVAYATYWTTNSAFFPAFERLVGLLMWPWGATSTAIALFAKGTIAAGLGLFALMLARTPAHSANDLIGRSAWLIAVLLLVSPAQFPWYMLWFAPFLALRPFAGMRAVVVTVPLYYSLFHFAAYDRVSTYADGLVWLVWVPVWLMIGLDLRHHALAARLETKST